MCLEFRILPQALLLSMLNYVCNFRFFPRRKMLIALVIFAVVFITFLLFVILYIYPVS